MTAPRLTAFDPRALALRGLTGAALAPLLVTAVGQVASQVVARTGPGEVDAAPTAVLRDLRLWLGGLRLLAGVPFGHLVPDADLLPAESIRFFYLDRGWTDALVEGALSVSTVTTADRAALAALYGVVRKEVDDAERLVRLPGVEPGGPVPVGPAGSISGFLLRSRLVSGWPALHVRGYAVDNRSLEMPIDDGAVDDTPADNQALGRLGLLRMERLAPAVLLVLFDGVPSVVHLEEPRAGLQFGVASLTEANGQRSATVPPRDPVTGAARPQLSVNVPFRPGAPGVVDLTALAGAFHPVDNSLPVTLNSAELALQMLRFPFRAVFGDRTLTGGAPSDPAALFRPTLGLPQLAARFRVLEEG